MVQISWNLMLCLMWNSGFVKNICLLMICNKQEDSRKKLHSLKLKIILMSKRVVLRKPKRFLWKLLRSSKNLLFLNINKILSFKNLLDRAYFWFLASHVPNSKYTFAYGRNLFFLFFAHLNVKFSWICIQKILGTYFMPIIGIFCYFSDFWQFLAKLGCPRPYPPPVPPLSPP